LNRGEASFEILSTYSLQFYPFDHGEVECIQKLKEEQLVFSVLSDGVVLRPKIRFSVFRSLHLLMDDPEELRLRRQKIQGEINGYRGTAGDNDDERTRLKLETALLKLEMIDIKITATNEIKLKNSFYFVYYLHKLKKFNQVIISCLISLFSLSL
jgi:hypothetical protein